MMVATLVAAAVTETARSRLRENGASVSRMQLKKTAAGTTARDVSGNGRACVPSLHLQACSSSPRSQQR
eukprot:1477103-Pleurochrysis_carterae.AAC.1